MIQIRNEVQEIMDGSQPRDNNVLKNAPHPMSVIAVTDAEWNRYEQLSNAQIQKLIHLV